MKVIRGKRDLCHGNMIDNSLTELEDLDCAFVVENNDIEHLSVQTRRLISHFNPKWTKNKNSFLIFSKMWCFLYVPFYFFGGKMHARLCYICGTLFQNCLFSTTRPSDDVIYTGVWIVKGRSFQPKSERSIVIESDNKSLSVIVNKVAYAKKICSRVVGWLRVFPDMLLYWKAFIHQSKISLLFL